MTPAIRPARHSDAAQIAQLMEALGYPTAEAEMAERLTDWDQAPDSAVLVADDGTDEVVGAIAVHAIPYFERAGKCGRIVALVVHPREQGKGVGRALVEAAEREAAGFGCVTVEVTSSRARPHALAFYRSLGYLEMSRRAGRFMRELSAGALRVPGPDPAKSGKPGAGGE